MSEASFAELLEDSLVTIHNGEIVEGTVIGVKDNEIILNIGYKADGILTKNEYSNNTDVDLTSEVKPGDTMTVKVLKVNDGEGQVLLTYKRLQQDKMNERFQEAFEKQDDKIKDTEAIFATLNSEINRVGNAVSGIAAEASDLEQHKNTIAYGVDNLAQFAEENASSGQITKENMNNLEQVMEQCKGSTDKIANVSAELVTQIKKFSGNGLKKR